MLPMLITMTSPSDAVVYSHFSFDETLNFLRNVCTSVKENELRRFEKAKELLSESMEEISN